MRHNSKRGPGSFDSSFIDIEILLEISAQYVVQIRIGKFWPLSICKRVILAMKASDEHGDMGKG